MTRTEKSAMTMPDEVYLTKERWDDESFLLFMCGSEEGGTKYVRADLQPPPPSSASGTAVDDEAIKRLFNEELSKQLAWAEDGRAYFKAQWDFLFKKYTDETAELKKKLDDAHARIQVYMSKTSTPAPEGVTVFSRAEFISSIGNWSRHRTFLSHKEVLEFLENFENGVKVKGA